MARKSKAQIEEDEEQARQERKAEREARKAEKERKAKAEERKAAKQKAKEESDDEDDSEEEDEELIPGEEATDEDYTEVEEDDENIAMENADHDDEEEDEEEEVNAGDEPMQGDEHKTQPLERDRAGKIRLNKRSREAPMTEDDKEEFLDADEPSEGDSPREGRAVPARKGAKSLKLDKRSRQDEDLPRGYGGYREDDEGDDIEEISEVRTSDDADSEGAVEIRVVRDLGTMVSVGSWIWGEHVQERPQIDQTYSVPKFVAQHLAAIGAAVPFDKSIKFVSSVRTNTRANKVKFLR